MLLIIKRIEVNPMFLRKLTDEEVEQIKKSKDAANKVIKNQRKKLQAGIKEREKHRTSFKDVKLRSLIKQLEHLNTVTGHPVIIKVGDVSLYMNYDLLKKFERSLDKNNLHQCSSIFTTDTLIIRYGKHGQSGTVEVYGLPAYQVELLTGLPTIDLKG